MVTRCRYLSISINSVHRQMLFLGAQRSLLYYFLPRMSFQHDLPSLVKFTKTKCQLQGTSKGGNKSIPMLKIKSKPSKNKAL